MHYHIVEIMITYVQVTGIGLKFKIFCEKYSFLKFKSKEYNHVIPKKLVMVKARVQNRQVFRKESLHNNLPFHHRPNLPKVQVVWNYYLYSMNIIELVKFKIKYDL